MRYAFFFSFFKPPKTRVTASMPLTGTQPTKGAPWTFSIWELVEAIPGKYPLSMEKARLPEYHIPSLAHGYTKTRYKLETQQRRLVCVGPERYKRKTLGHSEPLLAIMLRCSYRCL
jgi:hypothetical protein